VFSRSRFIFRVKDYFQGQGFFSGSRVLFRVKGSFQARAIFRQGVFSGRGYFQA
jgi:hypothetical protein